MQLILLLALVIGGLFGAIYGYLNVRAGTIHAWDSPKSYNFLRLREKSKKWATSQKWEKPRETLVRADLSLTLGEYLFFFLFFFVAAELLLLFTTVLVKSKALLLVSLLLPLASIWSGFVYVQHRIDQRKRLLQGDFIHCFSRLADFVYFTDITDYEKIRRSLVGTRVLHKALVEEVYYRKDPKAAIQHMEEWVSFREEKLLLRNAFQEALYSFPDIAKESLLDIVINLRNRRASRWRKELVKIEFIALLAPRAGAAVFGMIMITAMLLVIRAMMGWK